MVSQVPVGRVSSESGYDHVPVVPEVEVTVTAVGWLLDSSRWIGGGCMRLCLID
jgi:hypothetical protein